MEQQEISMVNGDAEATPFIRVGTTYYKVVPQPQPDESIAIKRLKWDKQTISFDYGKKYLKTIPHYNGFCTVPVHVGYTREVKGFYNIYEPISHIPEEGSWKHIDRLVAHIFGEQYELSLDYLQLLYLQPRQKFPILLLVSEERNTGRLLSSISSNPSSRIIRRSTPTRISAASSTPTGRVNCLSWLTNHSSPVAKIPSD